MCMRNTYNVYMWYNRVLYVRTHVHVLYRRAYAGTFSSFPPVQNQRGKVLRRIHGGEAGLAKEGPGVPWPQACPGPGPPSGSRVSARGTRAPPRRRGVTAGAPSAYVRDGRLRGRGQRGLRRRSAAAQGGRGEAGSGCHSKRPPPPAPPAPASRPIASANCGSFLAPLYLGPSEGAAREDTSRIRYPLPS